MDGLQRETCSLEWEGAVYQSVLFARSGVRRPLVLVLPNVEGLNEFDEKQAAFLAQLGYVGLAIDLYGPFLPPEKRNFLTVQSHPSVMQTAFDVMNYWVANVGKLRAVLGAWLQLGQRHSAVQSGICGAIGYCFGGLCCLEMIRAGLQVRGVVSFHGVLHPRIFSPPGRPVAMQPAPAAKHTSSAKVLIETGVNDGMVPPQSLRALEAEMQSAGVKLVIHSHAGAGHGFALPGNSLHAAADRASTLHMLQFLQEIFPEVTQLQVRANAAGTPLH
eukprot:gnl/MRDRNA2_/MRDRNA2_63333_c0_seq2.p1 gnl/MRDRNA2_/MRDRNA2_63333_c0~~gnl/MRDRNA2_/MRDRNA2_63333_c0_seq2.p1  ORF type:complete len:274 (+),score=44.28 gnl/MRDRNA2_/MRDRNA2_63333_c0_seq2:68-889(+)